MERSSLKYVTATGSAINLELGFVPNWVHMVNITQRMTFEADKGVEYSWNSKMDDASYYGLESQTADTDGLEMVSGTSNGFTPYDAEAFTDRQMIITGVSKATRGIVTIGAGHGLTAANDGDSISFNFIGAGSMVELNSLRGTMEYINSTTFYVDIDTRGFTTWSGTYNNGIAMNITTEIDNLGFKGITLGTAIQADTGDVWLVESKWFDSFEAV